MKNTDLQKEIDTANKKRLQAISENTVECNAPEIKRSYTYRKSTIITAINLSL